MTHPPPYTQPPRVVRFDIAVAAASYRTLIEGLRATSTPSRHTTSSRTPRSSIRAAIELDLDSKEFAVRTLGRHRLPQQLRVTPGSRSHSNITSYLAAHIPPETTDELSKAFAEIILHTNVLPTNALTLFRSEISFEDPTPAPPHISPSPTEKIVVIDAPLNLLALDLDDSPTLTVPSSDKTLLQSSTELLRTTARLLTAPHTQVQGNSVRISAELYLPKSLQENTDIFLHWGSYLQPALPWRDELASIINNNESHPSNKPDVVTINHTLSMPTRGEYGICAYVQTRGSTTPIWLGRPWFDDARIIIDQDDKVHTEILNQTFLTAQQDARTSLRAADNHAAQLAAECHRIAHTAPHLSLGKIISEVCDRTKLEQICSTASQHLCAEDAAILNQMLANYGIGEIVFATPEGPHAGAGGLAQVMSGLPPELVRAGIPVTIISPLYAHENGNRHHSAHHALQHGIKLGSAIVKPHLIGTVCVPLGPTYHSGSSHWRRHPALIPLNVYCAQNGALRLFLLANAALFDRLYQPVYHDEQLRRATVLSRGVLETIATPHFGIRPSTIISNDWTTACIPPLLALDPTYQQNPVLQSCTTLHMIHNGGADYHGRLPIHSDREDLWPLLGLAPDHFFGFQDPHNHELLNLTMAATRHAKGILTVSPHYAAQLTRSGEGDGLEINLAQKGKNVFGISNGINRGEIDIFLAHLAEKQGFSLDSGEHLLAAKAAVRSSLQHQFGLNPRGDVRLISMVGRMVEQKGVSLLSGFVTGTAHSTLEDILIRHPDVQILIAGPTTDGDQDATHLREALAHLCYRYPGRIAAQLEYLPHTRALEIIFGSSFFLMPSRFEPGGITQLEALAAGTLVIGRSASGIAATIDNFDPHTGTGTGFLCHDYTPTAFANTIHWALESTRSLETLRPLIAHARAAQHDWSSRVPHYRSVLQRALDRTH